MGQQDAHEVMVCLLDGLHEDMARPPAPSGDSEASGNGKQEEDAVPSSDEKAGSAEATPPAVDGGEESSTGAGSGAGSGAEAGSGGGGGGGGGGHMGSVSLIKRLLFLDTQSEVRAK